MDVQTPLKLEIIDVIKDKEQFSKIVLKVAIALVLVTKQNYVINRDLAVFIKNSMNSVMRNKAKINILDFASRYFYISGDIFSLFMLVETKG